MHALGRQLKAALQRICDSAGIPARVVGEGVLFEVYFTGRGDHRLPLDPQGGPDPAGAASCGSSGSGGSSARASKFYLSIVHDEGDVAETIRAFESAIAVLAD